ncbi:hypothetical protein BDBG_08534 [Blastomyces gilchristii SLH14081]|uniref:Uncharacterized protein n=1 Tax=Blastomyces gilchristii (strain SLH14081) TaxID=559298 RepID=A0A179V1L2_BLAGS|nr:uncharacterized protein BDBG_08534 [Blastomyces gilchristii SLH14081]OAT13308.1 hypothetical protein BDBG_08534 [Blastomyces gilchristii SLH14081]
MDMDATLPRIKTQSRQHLKPRTAPQPFVPAVAGYSAMLRKAIRQLCLESKSALLYATCNRSVCMHLVSCRTTLQNPVTLTKERPGFNIPRLLLGSACNKSSLPGAIYMRQPVRELKASSFFFHLIGLLSLQHLPESITLVTYIHSATIMLLNSLLLCALGAAMTVSVDAEVLSDHGRDQKLPSVTVPECPRKGKVVFDKSVPEGLKFPKTQVDLCYSSETSKISPMLHLTFTAYDEKDFHFDPKQGTNDDIWKYSVMEAFIQRGDDAPQTYLEFEVNPNNVTYQSFIYNPSRVRAPNTPLDHAFISDPFGNEMFAETHTQSQSEDLEV